MNKIPLLTAQDVEVRVQQVTEKGGAILLLYKNARVDMAILDEVFGAMNWQRSHQIIDGKLYCTVSVWDNEKGQWVSKQDVGTESMTEADKGRASDSFKRACFNWGVGRELYNSPFIHVQLRQDEVFTGKTGKKNTYTKFEVTELEYDPQNRKFSRLTIVDGKGVERYRLRIKNTAQTKEDKIINLSERVRVINDVQYEVLGQNHNWIKIKTLSLDNLKWMRTKEEFKEAYNAIDTCINEKSL